MKKIFTNGLSLLATMLLFGSVAMAQTNGDEKQIVVTIRSTDADGAKITTTVVKTGEDAKNFDVKKCVAEQTRDKPDADVTISDKIETRPKKGTYDHLYNYNYNQNKNYNTGCIANNATQNKGFLGVSEYDNAEAIGEGVRIHVTRNAGAAKAGLKDDDVIIQLNKTPINSFNDISKFMRDTKNMDKVEVIYEREGVQQTAIATLGQAQDAWNHAYDQEKEACLGVYTSSNAVDGQRGAMVNSFTEVSAAQEVSMQINDMIVSVNGVRVKSHQDVWDEIAKYKPNDAVTVAFLRDNATKQVVASLKACKPRNGMDEEKVIVIPKNQEETVNTTVTPTATNLGKLALESFSASPNPTSDMVNVAFKGEAIPTNISFYDLTGKLLLQQNINDFNGEYNQRFDLNEYTKGVVLVKVQQGDKVFSQKIIVN